MQPQFVIPLILVLIPILAVLGRIMNRKWLRRQLQTRWGAPPAQIDHDILIDIARYWRARHAAQPEGAFVDDSTWNDLDMDEVFRRMNRTVSIPGGEVLYATLREIGATGESLRARTRRAEHFRTDERARLDVQQALMRVNKSHFHGASRYLFESELLTPRNWPVYYALALLMVGLIVAGVFQPAFFFLVVLLGVVNLVVYMRTQLRWRAEKCAVRHIASVLSSAQALVRLKDPEIADERATLSTCMDELRAVVRWLPMFAMEKSGPLDMLTDYLKIMFLIDMVSLCAITRGIRRHENAMRTVYAAVGGLDADIAVAALLNTMDVCCAPTFHDERHVVAKGVAHPLVNDPVRNDMDWRRGTLLTGSNASGKSTFIKAVAINCILAQTIHVCFAERFAMPRALVMSSMAVRDSVVSGESYFIAEIKSLKRLMDVLSGDALMLAFVDEILRGTNTIERIAASSAVLRMLAGRNVLCMTATHDVELTRMLESEYDNWHFREEITTEGVTFTYRLYDGPATSRNAIALLEQMEFDDAIVGRARSSVRAFEQDGRWPEL